MPTTTNSELVAILRSRKTPGALTKMNRKQLEALVESTGGMPRPSAPTSAVLRTLKEENDELQKLLDQERTQVSRHIQQRMLMDEENKKLKEENEQWKKLMKGAMGSGLVGKVEKLEEETEKLKEENKQLKAKHSQELALIAGRSAEYKKELTEFKEKLENVEEELETTEEDVEFVIAFANQEKEKLHDKIEELRDYIELGGNQNEIDVFNKIFNGTDGDDLSDEE